VIFADAPTDFWGIVVPGWIGAIGGLVGGIVAVVSLLIAVRSNEKASAARAAEAETRSVVVDTIAELQRENADAGAPAIRTTDVDRIRRERAERYDALLRRLGRRE
jgi:orotidine-5'-phosphate decarboxylase